MKLVGKLTKGATATALPIDLRRTVRFAFPSTGYVAKLSLYADSLGAGAGQQALRGVIYAKKGGGLVGVSKDVVVPGGQGPAWIDLPFASPPLLAGTDDYVAANLIANPGFEVDTSGWVTSSTLWLVGGATLTRYTSLASAGVASGRVLTTSSPALQGAGTSFAVVAGETYTCSIRVRLLAGSGNLEIDIGAAGMGSQQLVIAPTLTEWTTFTLSFTPTASGTADLAVRTRVTGVQDFLLDEAFVTAAAPAYDFGVQGGPDTNIIRTYGDIGTPATEVSDAYADGAAASFGSGSAAARDMSVFASWFSPWTVPPGADDFSIGRLPFELAQRAFSVSQKVASYYASLDWHGTKIDPERGSFCVVNSDKVLAGLLGQRVRIVSMENKARFVYAYVHNESSQLIEDLSIPRRLYEELQLLGTTPLRVQVEVLG